jgi:hypothetical protein
VISWLTVCTTGVSALIYILLNWIKPSAGKHSSFREVDLSEGISDGGSGRSSQQTMIRRTRRRISIPPRPE